MEAVGDLGDAKFCGPQKEGRFHHKKLVHIAHDRTSGQFPDYAGEVGGGDVQRIGVISDITMFDEIFRQQPDKPDEYIFLPFSRFVRFRGLFSDP